ncbi:contractile injection system tape measure protein [Flavobacterium sp. ENC]|uniref:contractile injection system tape measure protein n=1 Tax=Flavobacterium sp. ENC TaxID=2897330 RepID=UPI001E430AF8|nr:contractile injection system tape measure protein [Flavobacterium sp. ENC]MCD0467631.1 hypothetical protein [Flavobacterium sp. ENC]
MQVSERHSINKLFVEVNTPSKENAYFLKDHLDTFLKEELFPLLETYFDTLDKKMPLHSIQIEKLNMDLAVAHDLDFNSLKIEIMDQFRKQIGKQMEQGFPDTEQYKLVKNKEKDLNAFFSFLETGTHSWSDSGSRPYATAEDSFEKMIEDKAFGFKLRNALESRAIRIRFIKQLSDDQIYTILKNTFLSELAAEETTSKNIERIKANMTAVLSQSTTGLHQRNLIWDIVLSILLKHHESIVKEKFVFLMASFDAVRKFDAKLVVEQLNKQITDRSVLEVLSNLAPEVLTLITMLEQKNLELLQKNSNTTAVPSGSKTVDTPASENKVAVVNPVLNRDETKEAEILESSLFLKEEIAEVPANHYANNAGLILIHPFLKQLFLNCGLLNKDNTIKDPEVAAHLLHYTATAKEQDYENEMLFEKLLCNIPLNQTINRNIILSEEFKKHSTEMLRAALDHWPVMKNSSVALLQNEYLQRPGKIILTGDHPKVLVERKTQDILLDKITWNIGIVKLAWKNKVIFVDW